MKYLTLPLAIAGAIGFTVSAASAQTTLNVVSGGSANMVEYVTDYLGPLFESQNPGVKLRVTGTGPGDAGTQKILEKLEAQKKAGVASWDIDVAVGNQQKTAQMVEMGLLQKYRDKISTGKLASRDTARMALGVNVDGYVMPMFRSEEHTSELQSH